MRFHQGYGFHFTLMHKSRLKRQRSPRYREFEAPRHVEKR